DRGVGGGRRFGWDGALTGALRPPFGGQLVEASDRLGGPVAIEHLDPRQETVGSQDDQREDRTFVGPAADTVAPAKDPGDEEGVRLQGEDIVVADGELIDEIEPGAPVPQPLLCSARGPGP